MIFGCNIKSQNHHMYFSKDFSLSTAMPDPDSSTTPSLGYMSTQAEAGQASTTIKVTTLCKSYSHPMQWDSFELYILM